MTVFLGTYLNDDLDWQPVQLTAQARRQGVYIIGTPGTGKTTLLHNIALYDMQNGHGVCVLDPHGDLIDDILLRIPESRLNDVILFNPAETERPFGLNLLACKRDDPHEVRWVVSTVMETLHRLYSYSWGPRLEHVLRHALLTAMTLPESTLIEVLLLLTKQEYRKGVAAKLTDQFLKDFWDELPKDARQQYELISSTLNKLSPFLTDPAMRNIVGQTTNSVDLQWVMDNGKILLVNLAKGSLGEGNSSLLGSVLVNLILMAALRRRHIPYNDRRTFHLIVDEFQNFASESFAVLQSEARKYAVDVIVAHQYRDQLDELNKGSTLNVANFIVMRVSGRDSFELASQFDNTPPEPDVKKEPVWQEVGPNRFVPQKTTGSGAQVSQEVKQPRRAYNDVQAERANELSTLPNHTALCRIVEGRTLEEYRIETYAPIFAPDTRKALYVQARSSEQFGRDKERVEAEIVARLGEEYWLPVIETYQVEE